MATFPTPDLRGRRDGCLSDLKSLDQRSQEPKATRAGSEGEEPRQHLKSFSVSSAANMQLGAAVLTSCCPGTRGTGQPGKEAPSDAFGALPRPRTETGPVGLEVRFLCIAWQLAPPFLEQTTWPLGTTPAKAQMALGQQSPAGAPADRIRDAQQDSVSLRPVYLRMEHPPLHPCRHPQGPVQAAWLWALSTRCIEAGMCLVRAGG